MDYVRLLKEKGVSPNWLLFGEGEMMEADNKNMPTDYEELKKENSYLKDKIEKLEKQFEQKFEEQRIKFLAMIHDISGKHLEHKLAAVPNEKRRNNNSSSFGRSYVPATN